MSPKFIEAIRYIIPFFINFMRSKEVKFLPKVMIIAGVVYLVSFIDLIPDFIPFVGLLDDVILVPLLVGGGYKMVTSNIIGKLWDKTMGKTTIHPLD